MKKNEETLSVLGNKYSRSILTLTSKMECSAFELCHKLDIPLATVYRKLKHLEDIGMIKHVKTIIHKSGNEEKYYRCLIRDINVNFRKGMLSVDLKFENCNKKIVRLWHRFTNPNNNNSDKYLQREY